MICFLLKQVCGVATYLKSLCMLIRLGERTNYAMNMEKIFTTVVSLDILCRAFQRDNVSRECGHQSSLDAVVSIRRISRICIQHKLRYFWTDEPLLTKRVFNIIMYCFVVLTVSY